MMDPSLSLAISVQSNPGVFALLLGSGVSRSAGMPTGWEIVVELIRKLAALKGEDCTEMSVAEEISDQAVMGSTRSETSF